MPIIVSTNLKKLNQKPYMTYTRDTKNFDAKSFQKDLLDNLSIKGNGCEEDRNSLVRNFTNIFNDTLNNHAPLRKQTRKERKLERKPWLTKEILIQGVHKVRVHFRKFITLFVLVIERLCKQDLIVSCT